MKKVPLPQPNNMDPIFSIFFDIGDEGLSK